jgi:hypothetical protein
MAMSPFAMPTADMVTAWNATEMLFRAEQHNQGFQYNREKRDCKLLTEQRLRRFRYAVPQTQPWPMKSTTFLHRP